jgi:hypothetical protein
MNRPPCSSAAQGLPWWACTACLQASAEVRGEFSGRISIAPVSILSCDMLVGGAGVVDRARAPSSARDPERPARRRALFWRACTAVFIVEPVTTQEARAVRVCQQATRCICLAGWCAICV